LVAYYQRDIYHYVAIAADGVVAGHATMIHLLRLCERLCLRFDRAARVSDMRLLMVLPPYAFIDADARCPDYFARLLTPATISRPRVA